MGFLGGCVKVSAVCVLLFALFIGSLYNDETNVLKRVGFFRYMDGFQRERGPYFVGMLPAMHEGTPWGFTHEEIPDLTGQTIVVTGANTGLGYWTAYHLAKKGATVVATCRTQSKCDKATGQIEKETGKKVEIGLMDLSSFASIRNFAKEAAKAYPTIDSLVLNAGVMVPPFGLTKDGLETQIGTNHFGHQLLTDLLLPQLEAAAKKTGVATVVPVSSAAHYDSYPAGILPTIEAMNTEATYDRAKAYGQSKLANVLFAQELAERVKDKGILVNAIHPGGVDTELGRHLIDGAKSLFGEGAADFLQDKVLPKAGRGSWHPSDAALTQIYAAVGPKLKAEKTTGKYFHPIARENEPDLHCKNKTLQKNLWELTEKFIAEH